MKAQESISIWQQMCETHHQLLDLTTLEYSHLLSSDMESLEITLAEKTDILERIKIQEEHRILLLEQINSILPESHPISTAKNLIELFQENLDTQDSAKLLENQNDLLIHLINDIRTHNKKNQLFLNKALSSLNELKQEMFGKKSFQSYGPKGTSSSLSVRP